MYKVNTRFNNIKTIIDVAKIASVSKSTVSRAITNDPRIKKETKYKILKIIEKYNFYPNYLARNLRSTHTHSIGIIVGDINNPFYFDIIRGIEKVANERRFDILLENSGYGYIKELLNIKTLISKKIDGILMCTSLFNASIIPLLTKVKIPFIFIDMQPFDLTLNYVYADQIQSGMMAIKYLLGKGHKKILIVYGPKRKIDNFFIKGCKNALKMSKIKIDNSLIITCVPYLENVYAETFNFFQRNEKKVTAIIASDHVALAIYKAVHDYGLKIPEDISVFGNDDIPLAKYLTPPLTTIFQPKYEMGEIAAKILLDKIDNKDTRNHIIELKPLIIERESVISI